MKKINNLAVFCGASRGNKNIYADVASEFAELLVQSQITLVYGGAEVGLMGVIADRVLALGGSVIGVIPEALKAREIAHKGLTELHVVNSMHERKSLIAKLADGFVMLPGGVGSLDEFFEIFTWMNLGIHNKPCGILNVDNYFESLINFLKIMITNDFMKKQYLDSIVIEKNPQLLLEQFKQYQHSIFSRWEDVKVSA